MDRRLDPRSIVTPYAFSVHPDLLGRPLATPWQRLGAILVDLIVIGLILFLINLSGIGGLILGLFSAALLFWLAARKPPRDTLGWVFRFAVGCLGLVVLGVTSLIVLIVVFEEEIGDTLTAIETAVEEGGAAIDSQFSAEGLAPETQAFIRRLGVVEGFSAIGALRDLNSAEGEGDALEAATKLARAGFAAGFSTEEVRTFIEDLIPQGFPWARSAADFAEQTIAALALPVPDEEPTDAPVSGAEAPAWLADSAAADSVLALEERIRGLERDVRLNDEALERTRQALTDTQLRLEDAEDRSLIDWVRTILDDLGIGAGWAALYMTIIHVWWRGASVGKRMFGIRAVMIDKRPLNWWLSFERAGGYAAGFATGMLGFAQVFWDPNRQAIHDKVSETIVIQDGKDPVPGPWMEEGKAQWERARSGAKDKDLRKEARSRTQRP